MKDPHSQSKRHSLTGLARSRIAATGLINEPAPASTIPPFEVRLAPTSYPKPNHASGIKLADKVAVISGASRGIGLSVGVARLRKIFQSGVIATCGAFVVLSVVVNECHAQNTKKLELRALSAIKSEFGDKTTIRFNRATNKVDFLRLDADTPGSLSRRFANVSVHEKAAAFFNDRGQIFGLADPENELSERGSRSDELGGSHVVFAQNYKGVPVFGGVLIAHFNTSGELRAVNGEVVPYIDLDPVPTYARELAAATAVSSVAAKNWNASGLQSRSIDLFVYRTGMAQGVSGKSHLVWRVEVVNGFKVHEFVFVDAHNGEVVDQIASRFDIRDRQLYGGGGVLIYPPISYPANPFWLEGTSFPTNNSIANEVILASGDTYDFFKMTFGRDSYDDRGGSLVSFFNIGFLDLSFADFVGNQAIIGVGDTAYSDDIIAHEWTHHYSVFTHGLVYAWQPGALNEAYSDIFGETIDILNGRGLDLPGGRRDTTGNACSVFTSPIPKVRINSPSSIANSYDAAYNLFGLGAPGVPASGLTGDIVAVDDGVGDPSDGCSTPFVNTAQIDGKIALISANQECDAVSRVKNAELSGAVAVILANDALLGEGETFFGGDFVTSVSIPSANVAMSTGELIRSQLANGVNVTIFNDYAGNSDSSYRWLIGEGSEFFGRPEALRDMWRPECYFDAGKTLDDQYWCNNFDGGGVHENSSVPNHAFALLVDGGNYNGQTVKGVGLTKAIHIYYRAMTNYQVPFTDFADHAEALEASANDLRGRNLNDLRTGLPSGEKITADDIKQLHAATLATELREPPAQCNFRPVLGKEPPDDSCDFPGSKKRTLFSDTFEGYPFARWKVSREGASEATFAGGNWSWVGGLPNARKGKGLFAYDFEGGCNLPDPSQSGVQELASPPISIPNGLVGGPHLSFDHWVALEDGFDGAQVMISVNGGPFQLVDPSAFIYNPYNSSLLDIPFNNPRFGQPAFTGTDGGSVKGSWGTSIVDLSNYARAGDSIRIRFDMSTDYCFGTGLGWYLDNVRVYACESTGQN